MYFPGKTVFLAAAAGLSGWIPLVSALTGINSQSSRALTVRDNVFRKNTTFHKSFNEATLFDGEINISDEADDASTSIYLVCTDCYITGQMTAELSIIPPKDGPGNETAGDHLMSMARTFADDVKNITDTVIHDVVDFIEDEVHKVVDDVKEFVVHPLEAIEDIFDYVARPTIDLGLSLSDTAAAAVATVDSDWPAVQFTLTLDAFEMFMQTQLDMSDNITYAVNLYTSESDVGIRVSNDIELGVVLTVDLILSAQMGADDGGGLVVDSGFHLRLDDGLALNVDLFGSNISGIVFNGGKFEFLPVTVSSVDATLNAVLRIGVQAGIVLSTKALTILDIDVASYSAGVETVVFADVANLTLSVVDADDAPSNVVECAAGQSADLVAEETFGFDIGAEVGASLQVADLFSWGVEPSKMLPVYYTSQEQCVERTSLVQTASSTTAAATATTATVDVGRQAAPTSDATTVLTTTFFYSAKACRSLGLINCPASLQTTTVTTATSTTTLTIPRGSSSGQVTWPAPTATTPLTKLATFGSNAKTIGLTASGTPSSFVPPGSHGHLTSKQEHIALGVGLGVGVPVLLSAIAAIIWVVRQKNRQAEKPLRQPFLEEQEYSYVYGQATGTNQTT